MIRHKIKHLLKRNSLLQSMLVNLLVLYLKMVYLTSRWQFIWPKNFDQNQINELLSSKDGMLFAMWHNRLAFGMNIYRKYNNVYALASTHLDGKIITDIIRKMNYKVIEGSTNKNPTGAIRKIISAIHNGGKIVITPDGPRGPIYKINSNITRIAYKNECKLIPVSCAASKYTRLKTWDQMILPKMFGKIFVVFGQAIELNGDKEHDDRLLEGKLRELDHEANKMVTR